MEKSTQHLFCSGRSLRLTTVSSAPAASAVVAASVAVVAACGCESSEAQSVFLGQGIMECAGVLSSQQAAARQGSQAGGAQLGAVCRCCAGSGGAGVLAAHVLGCAMCWAVGKAVCVCVGAVCDLGS